MRAFGRPGPTARVRLQCGRGGATEMSFIARVLESLCALLQCGRGGATEMSITRSSLLMLLPSLQCGRGGATEMRIGVVGVAPRCATASMRPWRSHGNEKQVAKTRSVSDLLQCGRGGATEMRWADRLLQR